MLHSDLRNFERTLMASMVSLFSLYRTKWQKLPRFLGQKCFLGALMETEKSRILWCRRRTVELTDSHINSRFQQSHYRFNTSMSSPVTKNPNFDL